MNWVVLTLLLGACGILLILERLGLPTTLQLKFKGDVKRESRWLAQYGQAVCPVVAALLLWQLDPDPVHRRRACVALLAGTFSAPLIGLLLKRMFGRVRPGRENAGRFLGPSLRHANYRESFPSNHTAAAFGMSGVLAHFYPQAAIMWWALAISCALLRYVLDAHWPSDILAGAALGLTTGAIAVHWSAAL
jgi:undecaprenyl-diphosphatase